MTKYYAGIGSRQTPPDILALMTDIAQRGEAAGYTLRSGGAKGADQAFEAGAGKKEIFLPRDDGPIWANAFTDLFHPNPSALSSYVRQLHNRNALILLGLDGNTPVDFVLCWTKDGEASGGTGQAIRISECLGIPVYNLFHEGIQDRFSGGNNG